jgi:hypothetical protein
VVVVSEEDGSMASSTASSSKEVSWAVITYPDPSFNGSQQALSSLSAVTVAFVVVD